VEDFGLHDKLEIENREFHIHTGTMVKGQRIISEVFEKGLFLIAREYNVRFRNDLNTFDYEFLNEKTQEFHHQVIDELEALYHIESKLRRYKHPKSHYRLGVLFLRRNLFEEAINQFKIAIDQDDQFIKAFLGLGICYLKTRQVREAIEIFQLVLDQNEQYPDVLNYIGLGHLFDGDHDQAMALFKEAIKLNPNYSECQFNFGVALYKSALDGVKNPDEVTVPARVSISLKQVKNNQKYLSNYWQNEFGKLLDLLKGNNHQEIMPQLEQFQLKLVDFVSDRDKIYEFYLRFLFGGKDVDLNIINNYQQYFDSHTSAHQQYPDYWDDQGTFNLIKSRGLLLKAMSEFEKAIEIGPQFSEAKQNLQKIKSNEKGFMILLRAILK
jgi:tetratricopeptide (TPR) repeat protein